MFRSTAESPPSEEDVVLALQNYFHEMQTAQIELDEIWVRTEGGERLPDEDGLKHRLRMIASRAELIALAFVSLRIMREFPQGTTQRWAKEKDRRITQS